MRIHVGSDHAGFDFKAALTRHLQGQGHEVVDHGAHVDDPEDDYPAFCIAAAQATVAEPGSLGVVIGGSGNGEQIAANKVPGVRAALAWNQQTAALAREHNDANIVSIGARMHDEDTALALVDTFVATAFSHGARHERRIAILASFEATHQAPPPQS
jgi:ribose 5-phosphate isomerase B